MATDRIVSPAESGAIMLERSLILNNYYGCIQSLEKNGKSRSRGSVTFLQVDNRKLLITNQHVIAGLRETGLPCQISVCPQMNRPGATPADLCSFSIDLNTVIWESSEKVFDICVLPAPHDMTNSQLINWFDSAAQFRMMKKLRSIWRKHNKADAALSTMLMGYPNAGHVSLEEEFIEVLGAMALPVYIAELADTYHEHVHGTGKAPQMTLEIDAYSPTIPPSPNDSIQNRVYNELSSRELTSVDFGGCSGGPVIWMTESFNYLIGVTKEGGVMFGRQTAFATAIDDIIENIIKALQ